MIVSALLLLMAMATFLQPDSKRFTIAFVFLFVTVSFDILMKDVEGFWYYFGAAFCDAAIATMIFKIKPLEKISISLIVISFVSFWLNIAGYISWRAEQDTNPYWYAFILLYTWAILSLLKGTRADVVGIYRNNWRSNGISSSRGPHMDNS